jgi:hypothetical protein
MTSDDGEDAMNRSRIGRLMTLLVTSLALSGTSAFLLAALPPSEA